MIRPTEGLRTEAAWVGSKPVALWVAAEEPVAWRVVGLELEAAGEAEEVEQAARARRTAVTKRWRSRDTRAERAFDTGR
jgi:hypothetical protein